MAKIAYVNGHYVHQSDAMVSMEDRGYQFADGIYEVIAFYNQKLLDEDLHLARLWRSLQELHIAPPMSEQALKLVIKELISRNDRIHGTIYLQITRGAAKRDHAFSKSLKSILTMSVTGPKMPKEKEVKEGVSVITQPEIRWQRRDIKSIALLPNILAKQAAASGGAREAWLVNEQGVVTEGSVSNNAIVNAKGEIITHPADNSILWGITRHVVLDIARQADIKVIERPFSLKEALQSKEAFMLGTTTNVLPVTRIDGKVIGDGKPGKVTQRLLSLYYDHIFAQTGMQWK